MTSPGLAILSNPDKRKYIMANPDKILKLISPNVTITRWGSISQGVRVQIGPDVTVDVTSYPNGYVITLRLGGAPILERSSVSGSAVPDTLVKMCVELRTTLTALERFSVKTS